MVSRRILGGTPSTQHASQEHLQRAFLEMAVEIKQVNERDRYPRPSQLAEYFCINPYPIQSFEYTP